MSNITTALNDQIRRLARREVTTNTRTTRKLTAQYRRDIAALKRQLAAVQKIVTFLERQEKRRVAEQPVPQEVDGIRFRADGLRSHRARLGLSAKDYGKLVGVAGLTIYQWEGGKARPRKAQVAKLAAVRGLGKREAFKRLDLMGVATGQARQRGQFNQTAEEFITALVKTRKAVTSNRINAAWKQAGRGGRADNTLSRMVKAKALKRTKLKDGRGSQYSVT